MPKSVIFTSTHLFSTTLHKEMLEIYSEFKNGVFKTQASYKK